MARSMKLDKIYLKEEKIKKDAKLIEHKKRRNAKFILKNYDIQSEKFQEIEGKLYE